ncbi:MAG TPA: hypothetical protein PKH39_17205 [Woeseiaceae bacterium]|nr:hypothetical protein [Woeseiaceae bacterium]
MSEIVYDNSSATIAVLLFAALIDTPFVDFDRPRRGLIEVSQKSMLDLQTSMHESMPR